MSVTPKIQHIVDAQIDLTDWQRQVLQACVGRDGRLRMSKPKEGNAAYVWRMIAFMVSRDRKHQCMPCTADFDIPDEAYQNYPGEHSFQRRSAYIKEVLDPLVDRIVNNVPKSQWAGVARWANAMGYTEYN